MSKFIDEAVALLSKSIIKLLKPWLIGYDKVEVIKMKKSVSYVDLLDTTYLERRKLSFLMKANILCVIVC